MKTNCLLRLATLLSLAGVTAQAAVIITSDSPNSVIPDDSATGLTSTVHVTESQTISSVSVSLDLSVPSGLNGWIGDLYAYVQHGSDLAVLLNRPGRTDSTPDGYNDGQNASLTFTDGAVNGDIHDYRFTLFGNEITPLTSTLGGIWAPDGRVADPATVTAASPRSATLSQFTGGSSDGSWTLFIADLSGGGQYRLDSWSLTVNEFTPVPEPASMTVLTAVSLGGWLLFRRACRR